MATFNVSLLGTFKVPGKSGIRAFVLEPDGRGILAVCARGQVLRFDLGRPDEPESVETLSLADGLAASAYGPTGGMEAAFSGRAVQCLAKRTGKVCQAVLPAVVQGLAFDNHSERLLAISSTEVWEVNPISGQASRMAHLPSQTLVERWQRPWNRIHACGADRFVVTNGTSKVAVIDGSKVEAATMPSTCLAAGYLPGGGIQFFCVREGGLVAYAEKSAELWRTVLSHPALDVAISPNGTLAAVVLGDGNVLLRSRSGEEVLFPRRGAVRQVVLTGVEAGLLADGQIYRYFLGSLHSDAVRKLDLKGGNLIHNIRASAEEVTAGRASLETQRDRVQVLLDAWKHAEDACAKKLEAGRKEREELVRLIRESQDPVERERAMAILPLIDDHLARLQLQLAAISNGVSATQRDLISIDRNLASASYVTARLDLMQEAASAAELRAKCRTQGGVHIAPFFGKLLDDLDRMAIQGTQGQAALPAAGDGRGFMLPGNRDETERQLIEIETMHGDASDKRTSLDRLIVDRQAALEERRSEVTQREGTIQELETRLAQTESSIDSLKDQQTALTSSLAAQEGKVASNNREVESLRQKVKEQEALAEQLETAAKEEREKLAATEKKIKAGKNALRAFEAKGK